MIDHKQIQLNGSALKKKSDRRHRHRSELGKITSSLDQTGDSALLMKQVLGFGLAVLLSVAAEPSEPLIWQKKSFSQAEEGGNPGRLRSRKTTQY